MIAHLHWLRFAVILVGFVGLNSLLWGVETEPDGNKTGQVGQSNPSDQSEKVVVGSLPQRASAVFAGGCFWCMESDFERAPGVIDVISGYSGGRTKGPTYETYAAGGHREVIFVVYDPTVVTYGGLVEYLLKHIDPINRRGQFQDPGTQYAPAIYFASEQEKTAAEKVIASIEERKVFRGKLQVVLQERQVFWPAEDYHQNYHVKNSAKYQFYRMSSGRDAFINRHWGLYANELELPGAFPEQHFQTNSVDSAPAKTAPIAKAAPGTPLGETSDNLGVTPPVLISGTKAGTELGEETRLGETSDDAPPAWTTFKKPTTEALRKQLTKLQYRVTQNDETEQAYANQYWDNHQAGIYVDVVSGAPLFSSSAKYESGTGWPSFFQPIVSDAVVYKQDHHLLYTRIEVRSRYGDSHLGHIFDDGPIAFGGKRFCMNSAALRFVPREKMAAEGYEEYLSQVELPPSH